MTTHTHVKKALEAANATETFAKFDEINFTTVGISLLMDHEVCDEVSLKKTTVEELVGYGLSAEEAASLKSVFPSAT